MHREDTTLTHANLNIFRAY